MSEGRMDSIRGLAEKTRRWRDGGAGLKGGGMNRARSSLRAILLAIGIGGMSMNASGFLGFGGTNWKEEVLLHDGSKIVVERWQKRGGSHEIGKAPPVKEQSITFALIGNSRVISWHDPYSKDVGSANFELLALHILNQIPYIVTLPYGCVAYNKWGRPNPPYVVFKYEGETWQRIPMSDLPAAFNNINLVVNTSKHEEKLGGLGKASAEEVRKMNSSFKQSEYRSILREPLAQGRIDRMCEELVLYRGHWIRPNDPIGRFVVDGIIDRQSK
jgi:hypothetical protein